MNEKPVVIVISDLHLGGGPDDPGDDHVYDQAQLCNFIQELLKSPEGQRGDLELFINGDFLDFAQTNQAAYTLGSAEAWCSEPESMAKLEKMLSGHANIFEALKNFGKRGNQVTIAAGNHDVDLFWPEVQKCLGGLVGNVRFVPGEEEWSSRFQGKLRIAHGHQKDRGNRFQRWADPVVWGPDGQKRLEMCPGTLFMVKFVNWLEETYPFADNIKPISALAGILGRENKLGALTVAWMLTKFCATHPHITLEADSSRKGQDIPSLLVDRIRSNSKLRGQFVAWYRAYVNAKKPDAAIKEALMSEDTLADLLMQVMRHEQPSAWKEILDTVSVGPTTLGSEEGTLELGLALMKDEKQSFRDVAKKELSKDETRIVILGHTHSPDGFSDGEPVVKGKQYFNPGSWTRYADVSAQKKLRLEDLRDESKFPYQLNYVRVELRGTEVLGKLYTFSELKPSK